MFAEKTLSGSIPSIHPLESVLPSLFSFQAWAAQLSALQRDLSLKSSASALRQKAARFFIFLVSLVNFT